MNRLKIVLPAAVLVGGFLVCSMVTYGKPDFAKETKKGCPYCHVNAQKTPKDLKDAGKYFKEHKTLDGFEEKK